MLMEVMIAVLVFSIGVLAIVKLNAVAARQSSEAEYRSIASLAVNDLIGRIWASDRTPAVLQARLGTGGDLYKTWHDSTLKESGLPNVTVKPAEITVTPVANIPNTSRIVIKVYWKIPGKDWMGDNLEPHQYTATMTVRQR